MRDSRKIVIFAYPNPERTYGDCSLTGTSYHKNQQSGKEMRTSLNIRGHLLHIDRPIVAAIVNVTPDSFYSGSRTEHTQEIARKVRQHMESGADWLDVGGYSSRPGASEVDAEEEYSRLARGLEVIRRDYPETVVSVDTYRADVARRCVEEWNVEIINDIGGGTLDPDMWAAVAELRCGYVLMHMRGTPATMQTLTDYDDVTADVVSELAFRLDALRQMGVADVIIDPGFGFAKTTEQNFRLLADLREFTLLGCPILAGVSRKSMIWRTLGITPEESLNGTTALDMVALMNGASILRVHDAREAAECVRLFGMLETKDS